MPDSFKPFPLTIAFSIRDKDIRSFWVREQPDYSFVRKWCHLLLQSNWLTGFEMQKQITASAHAPTFITVKSSPIKANGYVERLILGVIKRTTMAAISFFLDSCKRCMQDSLGFSISSGLSTPLWVQWQLLKLQVAKTQPRKLAPGGLSQASHEHPFMSTVSPAS